MKGLVPWKRLQREMTHFREAKEDFFDRFFSMPMHFGRSLFSDESWFPCVDVSEGKQDIIVKAEIPGVDRKYIDISLDRRVLTIKERKAIKRKNPANTIIAWKVTLAITGEHWSARRR